MLTTSVYVGGSFPETRLSQLARLVRLRREYWDDLNEDGHWLLDKMMRILYDELRDLGYEENADLILSTSC